MEYDFTWHTNMPYNMKSEQNMHKSTYPWECVNTCGQTQNTCDKKEYVPIQSMGPEIYSFVYKIVMVNLNKHVPDKSKMPKAISKDEFKLIVNDCMCELTSHEKSYMDMIKSRVVEQDGDDTRAFCKNCNSLLKTVVEVALITSLVNGGCEFCF